MLGTLGCDGTPLEATDCSDEGRKQFIYDVMSSVYLWADKVPAVALEDFETPEELFEAMVYREVDHWSSIIPLQPYVDYFQKGETVGFGYSHTFDASGRMRITWVISDSPAGQAGLRRGDSIEAIGGKALDEIVQGNLWAEVLGPNEKGAEVDYQVRRVDGTLEDLTIAKDTFEVDRVPVVEVIHTARHTVGYVLFMGFVAPAEADLRTAFAQLAEEGVDTVVVDLRYNGGGYVYLAGILGSLIGGAERAGEVLLQNSYNERWSAWNSQLHLTNEPEAVGVDEVVFLTSGGTASASEILINGLRPLMNVKLVGERTYGKPVGADAWQNCDTVVSPITFRLLNKVGEGDYFEGLSVDCEAGDDLDHQLGDQQELRLETALRLIDTGTCYARPSTPALPTQAPFDVNRAREQLEQLVPPEMPMQ
jgi:hypothetical protein